MTRNKLSDLTNHLFEQLERLNDDDVVGEQLEMEIKRATAMGAISKPIIDIATLSLKAKIMEAEHKGLEEGETFLLE